MTSTAQGTSRVFRKLLTLGPLRPTRDGQGIILPLCNPPKMLD